MKHRIWIAALLLLAVGGSAVSATKFYRLPWGATLLHKPSNVEWRVASGAPSHSAPVGSIYSRTNGSTDTSVYIKTASGTSGWKSLYTTSPTYTDISTATVTASGAIEALTLEATQSVTGDTVVGTTSVTGDAVVGTTSVSGGTVAATTSVTGATVVGTTSVTSRFIHAAAAGTEALANSAAVTLTAGKGFYKVVGDGGATTGITMPEGTTAGETVILQGTDNTNTVTLADGSGNLQTEGSRALGANDSITLLYNGADWIEISFSNT